MLVTVFTPTYNRAYILETLYQSLIRQSCKEFEWIIVDDGSTDGTADLVNKFIAEEKINIKYIYKQNGGKQQSINIGAKEACGELFFIVDSDDYLTNDAIEEIHREWMDVVDRERLGGLCFRIINYTTGRICGGEAKVKRGVFSSIELEKVVGIAGDKSEVFRTDLMRKNPFPLFKGEKVVPEALIWNRITEAYPLLFIDKGIYYYEYLNDGLTNAFKISLKKNPKGFGLYYKEMLGYRISLTKRIKMGIRLLQCIYYNWLKK